LRNKGLLFISEMQFQSMFMRVVAHVVPRKGV
jgi:hypothetical protein